jgi:hypothetical protein
LLYSIARYKREQQRVGHFIALSQEMTPSVADISGAEMIVDCNVIPSDRGKRSRESVVVSSHRELRSRYQLQFRPFGVHPWAFLAEN